MEVAEHNSETGYHMGVYLCLGQSIHGMNHSNSICYNKFASYHDIHQYMSVNKRIFLFLGEGKHKIKKKAEQIACDEAIKHIEGF
jgi:hypothetical protein